ncbi:hypothetical protein PAP_01630 [Palaeococcus pacificus DY20341]|uniref:Uncharacterized protein n=1 Tax=Palaeococcus pacificus DY20341 TaxID=1343739 RepID=A0A075LPZ7_9EURY|nr:hypothetical protein [Palaeococcus pacificus]AIF68765.1 hypothetical protein PAP_01630 [Palaeococcus pacificus DY20341]
MRLIRFGPSLVFLRVSNVEQGEEFLSNLFGVQKLSVNDAMAKSEEFHTIVFVTPPEEWKTTLNLKRGAFLVSMRCDSVLKELLNSKAPVERVNLGPHILVLRLPKGAESASLIISNRYGGQETSFARGVNEGEENDTLLLITDKKLSNPIGLSDLKGAFLIQRDFIDFYRTLSLDLPVLLYKTLPKGWEEVVIRIYDTEKRYEENIERLLLVLEDLDLGFVVSEGWDWDYPRPFMRIKVYKVKLITWEDPLKIKFLLKGLEYRGYKRFADIDVFIEGKKISWAKVAEGFDSKFEVAEAARKELESLLSEEAKEKLHEIEAALLEREKTS